MQLRFHNLLYQPAVVCITRFEVVKAFKIFFYLGLYCLTEINRNIVQFFYQLYLLKSQVQMQTSFFTDLFSQKGSLKDQTLASVCDVLYTLMILNAF